jgi:nitrile hydratase subunit beta
MNGIHDMGGMHGMGPIEHEKNEPVFHEPWEGRVHAVTRAVGAWRKGGGTRYELERLPPADYLRMSYYEKWLARLVDQVVNTGLVTKTEMETGKPDLGSSKATPPLTAAMVPGVIARGAPARRDVPAVAQFKVGQRVRARNIHPTTHTRLPRYARGKRGSIARDYGIFVFPDTNVRGLGEKPQHVYSVRFAARALWGDQASPRDSVYIDMWDDYLERA